MTLGEAFPLSELQSPLSVYWMCLGQVSFENSQAQPLLLFFPGADMGWGQESCPNAMLGLTLSTWLLAALGTCRGDEFRCGDGTCVPSIKRCNQEQDCSDGSDEAGCLKGVCGQRPRVSILHEKPDLSPNSGRESRVGSCLPLVPVGHHSPEHPLPQTTRIPSLRP